jgi:putative heme degradation protein
MGQSVSSIDLRITVPEWRQGFAVREETARGLSERLQFFDRAGRAIHKLYLREQSDRGFFEQLVREHTAPDQSPVQLVEAPPMAATPRPDAEINHIASAYIVRESMVHGVVTSLELYDAQGEQIALLVGARKCGQSESESWRALVESAREPVRSMAQL